MLQQNSMFSDTRERLSTASLGLHWIIAIGMIALIAFGIYIEDLPRGPEKFELIGLHKSLGITLFAFALIRLFWRTNRGFPIPLSTQPKWQESIAHMVHWVLLLGSLLLPLSGFMMSIGGGHPVGVFGFEIIARSEDKIEILSKIGHVIHGLGGKLLIALILLHIVGAIKHERIDKDGTLSRMLGRSLS